MGRHPGLFEKGIGSMLFSLPPFLCRDPPIHQLSARDDIEQERLLSRNQRLRHIVVEEETPLPGTSSSSGMARPQGFPPVDA
jgi:hypothetical protein